MSNSQKHGIFFEETVQTSKRFQGADVLVGERNNLHDIPKDFDRERGLDTSVKAFNEKKNSIGLADLLRFWDETHAGTHRTVLVPYEQLSDRKVCTRIEEAVLHNNESTLKGLWGDLRREELVEIHEMTKAVPPGRQKALSDEIGRKIGKLREKGGIVKIARKIDSKKQRRVQAAISYTDLRDLLSQQEEKLAVFSECYGKQGFPIVHKSAARQRRKKAV